MWWCVCVCTALEGSVMFCTLACEDYGTMQYQNFSEGNPFYVVFVTKMKT